MCTHHRKLQHNKSARIAICSKSAKNSLMNLWADLIRSYIIFKAEQRYGVPSHWQHRCNALSSSVCILFILLSNKKKKKTNLYVPPPVTFCLGFFRENWCFVVKTGQPDADASGTHLWAHINVYTRIFCIFSQTHTHTNTAINLILIAIASFSFNLVLCLTTAINITRFGFLFKVVDISAEETIK